jgi:hypothetical protein
LNESCPPGVQLFFHPTREKEDDVPILRVLTGPQDPYTAERLGSLAFFSTQRGMEWYTKQFGPADFAPGQGMVYVTYFDDAKLIEEPVLIFNLQEDALSWATRILDLFKVPLACGCPADCPCGCRSGTGTCSCRSAVASFAARRMRPGSNPPDPRLQRIVLSQNCLWVSHQAPKALAATPLYQTNKFTLYSGGPTQTVQAAVDKPTSITERLTVAEITDDSFKDVLRVAKAELRKVGALKRWTIAGLTEDDEGLTLTLEAHIKELDTQKVVATADFEQLGATTFIKKLPQATLLLRRDEQGYKAQLSYATHYPAELAPIGTVTRYYNRLLKGLSHALR